MDLFKMYIHWSGRMNVANYMVIVDDEQMILNSLERELRTWARERDLTIHTAGSGEDALAFLEKNYLETVLVMSDQKMPGMKGNELLETCSRKFPQMILLMLTGYTDINDIVKTIRTGVFSFILKPWDHEDLIYEVTKAYNIYEARRKNNEYLHLIKNETFLAERLQRVLIPAGETVHGDYRISLSHRPGNDEKAGKDFVSYFPLRSGSILMLVGQVSGDSVRAMMLFSIVNSMISDALAGRRDELQLNQPNLLLAYLHSSMKEVLSAMPEIMVQCMAGVLNPTAHSITYSFGGAGGWFLLRGQGFAEMNSESAGFGLDDEFTVKKVKIEQSDTVVAPSPGFYPGPDMEYSSKGFARELLSVYGTSSGLKAHEALFSKLPGGRVDRTVLSIHRMK